MSSYLFCDTAYPPVVESALAGVTPSSWREASAAILATGFGTWNSWAHAMRARGWAGETYILNGPGDPFGESWDVIHVQAIESRPPEFWAQVKQRTGATLVGEFSHGPPSRGHLAQFDRLLTGFPHFARDLARDGFPIHYAPLPFDPRRLPSRPIVRDLPVTFVGSLGGDAWKAGQHAIAAVAERIPDFQWWGQMGSGIAPDSPLGLAYRGPAWGHDYFAILGRSRLTINRHHAWSWDRRGQLGNTPPFIWASNMRMFEATGMGACLLTEGARNLGRETDGYPSLFEPGAEVLTWGNPAELVVQVERALAHPEYAAEVAAAGQRRTLAQYTYAHAAERLCALLEAA